MDINQEESTLKILKLSILLKLLEENKYPPLLRWIDKSKGHFEIGFLNKNNRKWDVTYLDVFKDVDGDDLKRLKDKFPDSYKCKCKENFKALIRKWMTGGKLVSGPRRKDKDTGVVYIEYTLCEPDQIPELMKLTRKRKNPIASSPCEAKRKRRESHSTSHYSCLSVQSHDSAYVSSESRDEFCSSPEITHLLASPQTDQTNQLQEYLNYLHGHPSNTAESVDSTQRNFPVSHEAVGKQSVLSQSHLQEVPLPPQSDQTNQLQECLIYFNGHPSNTAESVDSTQRNFPVSHEAVGKQSVPSQSHLQEVPLPPQTDQTNQIHIEAYSNMPNPCNKWDFLNSILSDEEFLDTLMNPAEFQLLSSAV